MRSMACHSSRIDQEDDEQSQNEDQDCAARCVPKVAMNDLSLITQENEPDLVLPYALCASTRTSCNFLCRMLVSARRKNLSTLGR